MSRIVSSLMALLVAAGCSGTDTTGPMSHETDPSAANAPPAVAVSMSKSFPRSGALLVTKECSAYTGLADSFCTITSSTLKEIEVGSKVIYASAADAASLDSDIVLDSPSPGANRAFGHCALVFSTGRGLCTFSGGTGKFRSFQASVDVSYLGGPSWGWDGTYSFSPQK